MARIDKWDGSLSSFIYRPQAVPKVPPNADTVPLGGVPIAVKDIFDVAGMPTTGNSRLYAGRQPAATDAASVAALRRAGAVVLGKLAAWECGIGGTSFSLPWPPARNPWSLAHDPGGSSTGSAVAIAAGFCLGSLGSDTGGSIREPASWCGIAGLKPTYGLLDASGVMKASYSLDHIGPMARTAQDCALLLDALLDKTASDSLSNGINDGIAGLRIGIVDLDSEDLLDLAPDVAKAVDDVARHFAAAGATLSRIRLPPLLQFSAVCTILASAEGMHLHRDRLEACPTLYDPLTRQRLLAGRLVTGADYVAADCLRHQLGEQVRSAMENVDLLLLPTTRDTAPPLGGFDSHGGHPSLCRPWNVTGLPALSVRSGFDRNGLPIGLQIVGPAFSEAFVLRVGHALESLYDDRSRWPDLSALVPAPSPVAPIAEEAPDNLAAVMASAAEQVRQAVSAASRPASEFAPLRPTSLQ